MKMATAWKIVVSIVCSVAILSSTSHASGKPVPPCKCNPPANVQASTVQPIGGDKFDASFTWDQLQTGRARITVWNDSTTDQIVELHGGSLILLPLTPEPTKSAQVTLELSPAPVKIEPHHAASFQLNASSLSPTFTGTGSYVGVVEIKNTVPAKASVFQKVRITVQPPRPAIAKARFVVWRYVPFFSLSDGEVEVPLTGKLEPGNLPITVGYLQGDRGWAPMKWAGINTSCLNNGWSVVELSFRGLPSGRYEGGINLAGLEEKDSQTTITVVSKDIFLWPLLVIAMGITLAWKAKRYVGVLRLTWGLRKQEAEIGLAFQKSQEKFADLTVGRAFSSMSIAKDVTAKRVSIRTKLDALERLWTTSITGEQGYKDAVAEIKSLQAQIAQWPDVAAAAVSLDDAIDDAQSSVDPKSTVPAGDYSGRPLVLKNAQRLLLGEQISCDDIATKLKGLLDCAALARTWQESNENAIAVSNEYKTMAAITNLSAGDQSTLAGVKDKLIAVWTHLWIGADKAAFASGAGSDLDDALQGLRQIKPTPTLKSAFAPTTLSLLDVRPAADHHATLTNVAAQDYSLKLPANDAQRVDLLQNAINRRDVASVVLASVIAVVTGMNTNYWGDKPFGTFQDYAVLFLWAAGTKIGVDIIAAVTDKFVSAASAT